MVKIHDILIISESKNGIKRLDNSVQKTTRNIHTNNGTDFTNRAKINTDRLRSPSFKVYPNRTPMVPPRMTDTDAAITPRIILFLKHLQYEHSHICYFSIMDYLKTCIVGLGGINWFGHIIRISPK